MTALIYGPTGSGKTHGALTLARGLVGPEGKIAVINTEPKGTNWQIGKHQFSELVVDRDKGYDPQYIIDLVRAAADNGYGAVIVDSISDFWEGPGGLLEIKSKLDTQNRKMQFANWRVLTQLCDKINETVVYRCGIHVIYTAFAREKLKQDQQTGEILHLGVLPRVRQHLQEKLDILFLLDEEHNATFAKNRIGAPEWNGPITVEKAAALAKWFAGPDVQARKSDSLAADTITVTITGGKQDEGLMAWVGIGTNELVVFPGMVAPDFALPATLDVQAKPMNRQGKSKGRVLPMFEAVSYQPHEDEPDEEGEDVEV